MECRFKKGFDVLKEEIINNNSEIRHLIQLDDRLVFVSGLFKTIDSFDYLFCKRIHPAIKNLLKDMPGIFFQESYNFESERERWQSEYEYIIKIEDSEKYHFSKPLILDIKEEYKGTNRDKQVLHSGYYGSSKWLGLSFNSSGMIGFISDEYIPMLKGETIRREYRGGRWDKLYGFTEYRIIGGDEKIKEFIIQKNSK
jgi:hypothetical protein